MENAAKNKLLILLLAAITLVAVFTFFCSSDVASATEGEFAVVYPTNNYVQIKSADLISANSEYVTIFDKTAHALYVDGATDKYFSIDEITVQGIYLFGDTLFINATEGNKSMDLSLDSPVLTSVDIATPVNANFYSSDGTYLYAHASGTVAKYSNGFNLEDTYVDSAFSDKPVFVADGNKIYLYSVEYGINKYTVYDTTTGNSAKTNSSVTAMSAAIGDVIYVHNTTSILCISKSDDSVLLDSGITTTSFFAYGDKLFTANGINGYSIYTLNGSNLNLSSTRSMSGNGIDKLNTPSDVLAYGDDIVVADKGNNRILTIGDTVSTLTINGVSKLAASKARLYAASSSGISIVEDNGIVSLYELNGIIDLTYLDKLYVLTAEKLYALIGGALEEICTIENGIALSSAEDGNFVYVLTSSDIKVYNKNGEEALPAQPISGGKDLTVSYTGNCLVLKESGDVSVIKMNELLEQRYISNPASVIDKTYLINNEHYTATANSIFLSANGKLYFTADENLVGELQTTELIKSNLTPVALPDVSAADIKPYTLQTATVCAVNPQRFDTFMPISANEEVYVFETNSGLTAYKYGVYRGKTVFIYDNGAMTQITIGSINSKYIATTATTFYRYPGCAGERTMMWAVNRVLTILDDAGGVDGGKWYRTTYNGVIYYVSRADLQPYTEEHHPEVEGNKTYGKAKASRVGGTVSIYTTADTSSAVLMSVKDGTEVEVIEEYDDFYYVQYGNTVGYIQKGELKLGGLTTVQIVAIVLSVVVILAGIIVFAVTYQTKKKLEEEANN